MQDLLASKTVLRRRCRPWLLALGLACTPEVDPPPETYVYEPVVFPAEAELGGRIGIVLSSNYIPQADPWERYDLHPDRDTVEIHVVDESQGEVPATVVGVFNLEAAPTSALAATQPGAWVTVALVDLPDATTFDYTPGTTFLAEVLVTVREVRVDDFKGTVRIKGTGGAPTLLSAPGFTPPMAPLLAPQARMVRLRPVQRSAAVPDGFPAGAEIGALEADVEYISFCLRNPRAYATSDASGASAYTGAITPAGTLYTDSVRLVMSHLEGFTLGEAIGQGDEHAGEGPIVDLAFDKVTGAIYCAPAINAAITIKNLFVTDPQGVPIIDKRDDPDPDSTHLFELHNVDRDW